MRVRAVAARFTVRPGVVKGKEGKALRSDPLLGSIPSPSVPSAAGLGRRLLAPNLAPWLFGTGPHYIVNGAQKAALMDVIPPRHPFLFAGHADAWSAIFGAFSSNIGSVISGHTPGSVIGSLCLTIAAA